MVVSSEITSEPTMTTASARHARRSTGAPGRTPATAARSPTGRTVPGARPRTCRSPAPDAREPVNPRTVLADRTRARRLGGRALRQLLTSFFGLALVASGLAAAVHTPPAAALPTGASWSGDYATEELGDPWDFSNPEDWDIQARAESPGATGSVTGGVLAFDQTSAAGGVLLGSAHYGDESLQWGRSTWLRPIATDVYRTLSFRLFEPSKPAVGGIELLTCGGTIAACSVRLNFFPEAGWQTYTITLPAGLQVYSVLIVPGPDQRAGFQLDWVRLTRSDGQIEPAAAGSEPVPVVVDPDRGGGRDYASTVRGKAWTFDDASDVVSTHDLNGVTYNGGVVRGCNADGANDPAVVLAMGAPLDTDVYNRVTARVWYDGAFGLADARGGGMVARIMWHTVGTFGYQVSQDIVVYPGWNDLDLEMRPLVPSLVTENDIPRTAGWVGLIDEIRFDFHEDRGARCVGLDSFAVRATDEATPTFPIRFRDDARGVGSPAPGTTAEIFVDAGIGSFGGTRIASNVPVGNGETVYTWNGRGVSRGTYYVWVRLTDPTTGRQSSAYGRGALVVRGVPPLAPRSVTRTPSGVATGVRAVLANLTMTEAPGNGYITADACDSFTGASPTKSNGNFTAGQNIANLGVVPLGSDGSFCVFNESAVHLLADVQGHFATDGNLRFTQWGPNRVLDTRSGGRATGGSVTRVAAGVPAGAEAALVNLTMTDGTVGGYITADTCEALTQLPPTKSNGNFVPQRNVANMAVVPLGADGSFCVYAETPVHLLADVQGYFAPSGELAFTLLEPRRVLDTDAGGLGADRGRCRRGRCAPRCDGRERQESLRRSSAGWSDDPRTTGRWRPGPPLNRVSP
jgi:hypothetical protein